MRVIVAGSRTIADYSIVARAIGNSGFHVSEVVSGCARGVDWLGEEWATFKAIPIKRFRAQWDTHGKAAGPIRNEEMAKYADALIAVWDGQSRGTLDMINRAKRHGLKVYIHSIN